MSSGQRGTKEAEGGGKGEAGEGREGGGGGELPRAAWHANGSTRSRQRKKEAAAGAKRGRAGGGGGGDAATLELQVMASWTSCCNG